MLILTLNCGSSSAKYQVFDWTEKNVLAVGVVERIGLKTSTIEHKAMGKPEYTQEISCPSHKEAIEIITSMILDGEYGVMSDISEIKAVGHRIVHGGEEFKKSVIVDDEILKEFESLIHLAPLHNPANILGIKAAKQVLPDVPHCAVMDTAWHQTMPESSYMYALPYNWYEKNNVRRYGFHGTSYVYTAKRAAVLLGKDPMKTNLVIAHIGNGASVCAVKDGVSYDTSMGMTPLEGLIMGTRSGDMDPAIGPYIMSENNISAKDLDQALNKKSGVFGITEKFSDRRDIRDAAAEGDSRCQLAIDMECYRIKKYIGAYVAAIGKTDAVVMTAGVGEMAPHIRKGALSGLEHLGIILDQEKNEKATCRNAELEISADNSPVKIFVIPTDEELVMTEDTYALVNGSYDIHTKFQYSFQSAEYVNKARAKSLETDLQKRPHLKGLIAHPPKTE
ncbi:MAG: acetate kinase [Spirochaetia bacterium]|nr:acetate kinase [Spirochaetia bacterium]MCF7946826.1 acetate kinase [Spirochaetia bacterium]MCF7952465.1 acetate kinase [Spirochaetales bacterium]